MSHQRFTAVHLEGREQRIFRGKAQYIGWAVWESRNLGRASIERVKATDIPLPISLPRTQLSGHHAALKALDRGQRVGCRGVREGCQSVTHNRKYSNKVKIRALEFSAFSVKFICLCLPAFHRFFYMWLLWFSTLLYKNGWKGQAWEVEQGGKVISTASNPSVLQLPNGSGQALWKDHGIMGSQQRLRLAGEE